MLCPRQPKMELSRSFFGIYMNLITLGLYFSLELIPNIYAFFNGLFWKRINTFFKTTPALSFESLCQCRLHQHLTNIHSLMHYSFSPCDTVRFTKINQQTLRWSPKKLILCRDQIYNTSCSMGSTWWTLPLSYSQKSLPLQQPTFWTPNLSIHLSFSL